MNTPTGYYVFRPATGKINLDVPFMRNPHIAGVVLREGWETVKPTKTGPYKWGRLVTAFEDAREAGKSVMLEVLAGEKAPDWIGGNPAQYEPTYGTAYGLLVAAMGKQFAGYDNLTAVHCTLPSTGSAEFSNPPRNLVTGDWVPKALNVNKSALLALAKAFPNCNIVVNLHNPTKATDGFVKKQIAQGKLLLGQQFAVQYNALKADTNENYNLFQETKAHIAAGYPGGLEQVCVSTNTARYGGSGGKGFQQSLLHVKSCGAKYLIIYEDDDSRVTGPWS